MGFLDRIGFLLVKLFGREYEGLMFGDKDDKVKDKSKCLTLFGRTFFLCEYTFTVDMGEKRKKEIK